MTLNLHVVRPEDPDSEEDRSAVRQIGTIGNGVWLAPMLEGRMPDGLAAMTEAINDWSFVRDDDLGLIHQPLAGLGVNYYPTSTVRRARPGGDVLPSGPLLLDHSVTGT